MNAFAGLFLAGLAASIAALAWTERRYGLARVLLTVAFFCVGVVFFAHAPYAQDAGHAVEPEALTDVPLAAPGPLMVDPAVVPGAPEVPRPSASPALVVASPAFPSDVEVREVAAAVQSAIDEPTWPNVALALAATLAMLLAVWRQEAAAMFTPAVNAIVTTSVGAVATLAAYLASSGPWWLAVTLWLGPAALAAASTLRFVRDTRGRRHRVEVP